MPIIHSLDGTKHHPFVTPGGYIYLDPHTEPEAHGEGPHGGGPGVRALDRSFVVPLGAVIRHREGRLLMKKNPPIELNILFLVMNESEFTITQFKLDTTPGVDFLVCTGPVFTGRTTQRSTRRPLGVLPEDVGHV